ncbi:MAG: 5'/3'-nucleotidase SurE [Rhodospirillales bacterium]
MTTRATAHAFADLSRARVLITNDDGIHAPGIKTLARAVKRLAREVWVVAPETEQSATAHSLTLRRPLRIRKAGPRRFAIDGTPTDCVLLAINEVMKDARPDIVLSGINRGANLGDDVTYSGTIAAAIEAVILGVPAVALSQHYEDGQSIRWGTAEDCLPKLMKKIANVELPSNTLLNVNFPDCPAGDVKGIEVTWQGARKLGDQIQPGSDPKGDAYYWIGSMRTAERFRRGSDLHAVYDGAISVTPLTTDLTNRRSMRALKDYLA